jgi:hypothetical protein
MDIKIEHCGNHNWEIWIKIFKTPIILNSNDA